MVQDTQGVIAPFPLSTAADVDTAAERIFGHVPSTKGVLHTAAVARRQDGMLQALAVDGDASRPPEDAFVLGIGRARADAVVITGAILRAEPELRHAPDPTNPLIAPLTAWRHRNGRKRPFTTVVMTKSRDLDLDHPLFKDGRPIIVFTGEDVPPRFAIDMAPRGVIVMTDEAPSLERCLDRLERAGYAAITVEAGPTVASQLYSPEVLADETLLTVLDADDIDPGLTRGDLVAEGDLRRTMSVTGAGYSVRTDAGTWRFERFVR